MLTRRFSLLFFFFDYLAVKICLFQFRERLCNYELSFFNKKAALCFPDLSIKAHWRAMPMPWLNIFFRRSVGTSWLCPRHYRKVRWITPGDARFLKWACSSVVILRFYTSNFGFAGKIEHAMRNYVAMSKLATFPDSLAKQTQEYRVSLLFNEENDGRVTYSKVQLDVVSVLLSKSFLSINGEIHNLTSEVDTHNRVNTLFTLIEPPLR